jgi:hypothetical protein
MHGGSEFSAPGVIGQRVTERSLAGADAGPLLWVCVDGIDDALAQAQVNGGAVVDQPYQDGGMRWLATVRDPAGSLVGLVQLGPRGDAGRPRQPDSPGPAGQRVTSGSARYGRALAARV